MTCNAPLASTGQQTLLLDHHIAGLDHDEATQPALDFSDWPSVLGKLKFSTRRFHGDRQNIFARQRPNPNQRRARTGCEPEHPQVNSAIVKSQRGTAMQCFQEFSLISFSLNDSTGMLICSLCLQKAGILPRPISSNRRTRGFDSGHPFQVPPAHHNLEFQTINTQHRKLFVAKCVKDLLALERANVAFPSRLYRGQTSLTIKYRAINKSQRGRTNQSLHSHLPKHRNFRITFSIARDKDSGQRVMLQ